MEKPDAVPFGFIYISSIDARLDLSEEVISFKSSWIEFSARIGVIVNNDFNRHM